MHFDLKRDSHIPLYTQIAEQVRGMIAGGALKVGDRLPANRELAVSLGVNRTTVATAYAELTADGLIRSHVGRGTFISAAPSAKAATGSKKPSQSSPMPWSALLADQKRDSWLSGMPRALRNKNSISLAYSLPQADLFPLADFRRSLDRALRREGWSLLESGAPDGYAPLQEHLATRMALAGINVKPDHIVITNGCQQSLNLIRQTLVGEGDEVVIESPTYPGAISVFCGNNRYISVPVGEKGIDLDLLEDVLSQRRPKLIYTIPNFHNPTGSTMDLAARRRLIEIASLRRVPIIEDDIYCELRYDGAALPSLKALDENELVIYINSFSKVGLPGLRVGWIAAPSGIVEHLVAAKRRNDLHTCSLTQAAVNEFSRQGLLARHIKRITKIYAARRDVMLEAIEKYFPDEARWTSPEGGMAVWVRLPDPLDASQILLDAAERGVTFSPGEHFYCSLPQQNMMRLSFTMATPASIEDAIKRLALVIKDRTQSMRKMRRLRRAEAFGALV